MAERLLRARVSRDTPIDVFSAGTGALVGYAMDEPSATALRELGVAPDGHEAQRLTRELLAEADLVLTAERAHLPLVLRLDASASWRCFTLREFARLGAAVPLLFPPLASEEEMRHRVAELAAVRLHARRSGEAGAGSDDIADPFGATLEEARLSAGQVSAAIDGVITALGLPPAPSPVLQLRHQ
jgi:protein-tyrosine phosphatase